MNMESLSMRKRRKDRDEAAGPEANADLQFLSRDL